MSTEPTTAEIDILYTASNKLTQALTPAELLDAVSDYAQDIGASSGTLTYFYGDTANPLQWGELVAEWVTSESLPQGVGRRFTGFGTDEASTNGWFANPHQPLLITDATKTALYREKMRERLEEHNIASIAQLPLNKRGRWVGMITFGWSKPYRFSDRDQRIFTALMQQAAPIIDSTRLFAHIQERVTRAEKLLQINTALSQATDEAQILMAIALYTETKGADGLVLNYLDIDEYGAPKSSWPVALWRDGKAELYDPNTKGLTSLADFGMAALWINEPQKALFIENIASDPRISPHQRAAMLDKLKTRALAIIPLYSNARYQGVMSILWFKPYSFSDEERYVYTLLMQTLPSVVATRRAYLAEEEAREENELLYRASEAINAATSYVEVIEALGILNLESLSITLYIWENYDFEQATYQQAVATSYNNLGEIDLRIQLSDVPIVYHVPHDQLVIVEDTRDRTQIDEVTARTVEGFNIRSYAVVTLTLGTRSIGSLSFHTDTPRAYTEREKRLMTGIGDLVVAAMERIRLQAITEAARQQAETLAQITAALSQATDEQSLLEAVAALAERHGAALSILGYTPANQQLDRIDMVALRSCSGRSPLPLSFLPITSLRSKDFPLLRATGDNAEEPLFIEDIFTDPRTESGNMRDFCHSVNWSAVTMMPLKTGEQWQGVLTFVWKDAQTFTPEMRRLFTTIQPVAASVVNSRRAYLAEQARVHQLETVAKVSAAAASILDEAELLDVVSELARISFKEYYFFIYVVDDSGQNLVLATPMIETINQSITIQTQAVALASDNSPIARAGRTRRGVIVSDLAGTKEYTVGSMLTEANSEISVPMVVADKLIGVLDVQSREVNRFTESDIWVMATLADLIAVAVQNARSYRRAQELAALEERNRLARELHDSVSQALYGIALGARTARALLDIDPSRLSEPIDYVLTLAEAGLTEMRALIFELRPESLENEGLVTALNKQAASIQARHGIRVNVVLCEEPPLSLEIKETLYRITQEALHNTVKHAQATQIDLRLACTSSAVVLNIVDNGRGFDVTGSFPGHLGLQSMRERADRLNGTFEITSQPGEGTRIAVSIPAVQARSN